MTVPTMTPSQRLTAALLGRTPDRVPVLLPLTTHGAKELGLSIRDYFSSGEHVAEGQLCLQQKHLHDGLFVTSFAAAEAMPFGAEPFFVENGPPNMGTPPLCSWDAIANLQVPDPLSSHYLRETLRAIELCAKRVKGMVPIIGVAIPPFSLPALLLGLDGWLELLLFGPQSSREALLRVTTEFCVTWANLQIAAGADAIVLPDAVSSTSIVTRSQYINLSLPYQREAIRRIHGPCIIAAVGRVQPIADLLSESGALGVLVTVHDDIGRCRAAFKDGPAVIGNLNNIAMVGWGRKDVLRSARRCLERGAPGRFVLAPQWEIPYAVTDETLASVVEASERWGRYPMGPAASEF